MAKASENSSLTVPPAFTLGSSDRPSNVLVSCLLNGDNYFAWSCAMRHALRAKNKWGFIDGSIKKPEDSKPLAKRWMACNKMLVAWIFNSMEKDLLAGVAYAKDAKMLWDNLRECFSRGSGTGIYQIKSEIRLLKQGGRPVPVYYSKLKGLWDELESYLEPPTCTCGAAAQRMVQWEKEKIYQFLMGLDPEYGMIRSSILSTEPLPSLRRIYSIVVQDERQRTVFPKW